MNRYSRQIAYLGEKNQEKLKNSRVAVVGCGATGSAVAILLARAGFGSLILIDRDFAELSNLQSCVGFSEDDIGKPKAVVLKEKLKKINSSCKIEAIADDLNQLNLDIMKEADIILDCTDNMETRYLINEYCIKSGKPWIYSVILGVEGMSASFNNRNAESPCFRCLFPKKPGPAALDTCETTGILSSASGIAASWAVSEAIKVITGFSEPNYGKLFHFILDQPDFSFSKINKRKNCPSCTKKNFTLLEQKPDSCITTLCGEKNYQINPAKPRKLNLKQFAEKFKKNPDYETILFPDILHIKHRKYRISVFENARTIISGADSEREAKTLFSRVLG